MFCSQCGTTLNDGAKFCPNCGTPMNTMATSEPATPLFKGALASSVVSEPVNISVEPQSDYFHVPEDTAAQLAQTPVVEPRQSTEPQAPAVEPQQYVQPQVPVQPQQFAQPQASEDPQQFMQIQAAIQSQVAESQQFTQPQAPVQPQQFTQPQAPVQPQQFIQPQAPVQPQQFTQPQAPVQPQQYAQPQAPVQPQQYAQPQAYDPQAAYQPGYQPGYEAVDKKAKVKKEKVKKEKVKKEKTTGETPKKKSKALPIVIIITVLVLLLGGGAAGAYFYFTSPYKLVQHAMEPDENGKVDYEAVASLYEKLSKDDQKAEVEERMQNDFTKACNSYKNGNTGYSEIREMAEMLSVSILAGDKDFENQWVEIEKIEKSRKSYSQAEAYYALEDYQSALDLYMQVIPEDAVNYNDAVGKINVCRDMVRIDEKLFGTWGYTVECSKQFGEELFMNIDKDIYMDFTFEFMDDYSLMVSVDYDSFLNQILDVVIEVAYKEIESEGVSRSEVDAQFEQFYGMTYGELIGEIYAESLEDADPGSESYSWEIVDNSNVYLYESGITYPVSVIGNDEMILTLNDLSGKDTILDTLSSEFGITELVLYRIR